MNAPLERHKALREDRIAHGLCATCGQNRPTKGGRDCQSCKDRVKKVKLLRAQVVRHQEAPKPAEPEPDIWSVWDREDGLERAVRSADELMRVGA